MLMHHIRENGGKCDVACEIRNMSTDADGKGETLISLRFVDDFWCRMICDGSTTVLSYFYYRPVVLQRYKIISDSPGTSLPSSAATPWIFIFFSLVHFLSIEQAVRCAVNVQ